MQRRRRSSCGGARRRSDNRTAGGWRRQACRAWRRGGSGRRANVRREERRRCGFAAEGTGGGRRGFARRRTAVPGGRPTEPSWLGRDAGAVGSDRVRSSFFRKIKEKQFQTIKKNHRKCPRFKKNHEKNSVNIRSNHLPKKNSRTSRTKPDYSEKFLELENFLP